MSHVLYVYKYLKCVIIDFKYADEYVLFDKYAVYSGTSSLVLMINTLINLQSIWITFEIYTGAWERARHTFGIHVLDNVILYMLDGDIYLTLHDNSTSKYGGHCLDSEIDFGNIRLCGNQYDETIDSV